MFLCLHVEFVFMIMPFTWLTDDLLKDNPTSKLRLSISAAQICLFCEKYENPRTLGIVRACADKSLLCYSVVVVTHELHYESWKHDHICPCLEVMSSTFLVWNNEMLSFAVG